MCAIFCYRGRKKKASPIIPPFLKKTSIQNEFMKKCKRRRKCAKKRKKKSEVGSAERRWDAGTVETKHSRIGKLFFFCLSTAYLSLREVTHVHYPTAKSADLFFVLFCCCCCCFVPKKDEARKDHHLLFVCFKKKGTTKKKTSC